MIRIAVAACLLATGAHAETQVTPDLFREMTEGRTLLFDRDGATFGIEQYLPDRKVIWQYSDGTCSEGIWFANGKDICFVYDLQPIPQCWVFVRREDSFYARIAGLPSGDASEIRLARELAGPVSCQAPDLGV